MTAHDFEYEDLGGGAGHGEHVERRLARRDSNVLGSRAETRTAVGNRQVVVHGFGYADADDRVSQLRADLGHLLCGVHGVVAAVVEEIPDVMRPKNVDQALVLCAVLVDSSQFVARRSEGAARRMAEAADGGGA